MTVSADRLKLYWVGYFMIDYFVVVACTGFVLLGPLLNLMLITRLMFAVDTDVGYYLYPAYVEDKRTDPDWQLPPAEEGIMDVLPASLWMWW